MRDWTAPRLPLRWSSTDQPPFIGRSDEVAALRTAWDDAMAGRGRAVFVGGDPGIGKSRLVGEVCLHLHNGGATVLVGSCVPEFGTPYEPFVEPLRALLPLVRESLIESNHSDSLDVLDAVGGRGTASTATTPGQAQLYDAVVDVLRTGADIRPLVLVLEDLQWADTAAVRLLSRVIETTVDTPLLVIGTERITPPDRSAELTAAISRLMRLDGTRRIDLEPLQEDDITAYLVRRTGMTADAAAEPARMLLELTGGNPFLLRETWAHALAAVENRTLGVSMPETVHDLLRGRILALDSASRGVLRYAAVLGQEVDLGELIEVCDTDRDETLEGVDAAVTLGLLEPPRLVSEGYRFPHAIARQAALDQLPATQLTRIHAKVALGLEEHFPTAPRIVQRLAHHFYSARSLGYRDKASANLVRAGELAEDRLALEEAARLYERAAECDTEAVDAAAQRLRAARCWLYTADFVRARALCEQVNEEGTSLQRALAAILFAEAVFRPGVSGARAVELLRRAAAALPPDADAALRIRCRAYLGRALENSGDFGDGEAQMEQAIIDARQLGDVDLLTDVLRCSVTASLHPATVARTRDRAREAMALSKGPGDDTFNSCAHFLCTSSYIVGDPDGLDAGQRNLLEVARRMGAYWRYWGSCIRFARLFAGGRLADAAEACDRARRDEREFKSDVTSGVNALQSYMVRRESGALGAVARLVSGDESLDQHWAPGLLALYTELGMRDAGCRALAWLLERLSDRVRSSADWPAQLAFLVDAAVWLEDQAAAAQIRPWVAEFAGLNLLSGHFVAAFGSADRCLGQLDSICGTGDPEKSFGAALEMDRRMGAHLHVAHTWVALARHRRRVGAPDREVREAVESARAIAEPAGLARVLRLLQDQAVASKTAGPDGLTAREVEVIRLVAGGLSNRDVAAQLVISEHTAANHVRSILFKINAENRTQAAMYARELGLV